MITSEDIAQLAEDICGVVPRDANEPLRDAIPNSLALLQLLMAAEEKWGCQLDYSALTHTSTVADLATACTAALGTEHLAAVNDGDAIPLNPIQVAYLLGDDPDIELGGQATFIYLETHHAAEQDELADVIRRVVSRHDVFDHQPDLMSGTLIPNAGAGAPVTTESDSPGTTREVMLAEAKKSNRVGSMFRAHVIGEAAGASRVLWYFNMVLMDAGSVYVLLGELRAALAGKRLPDAPALGQAVRNIANRRDPAKVEAAREHWRTEIAAFPARPQLAATVRGDENWSTTRRTFHIDRDTVEGLEKAAAAAHVTVSALLLAINSAVITRWTNSPGITVNLTVSDRALAGVASSGLGDFTSSVLVGARPAEASSFVELARDIDRSISDGLANRALSGVEVMQEFMRDADNQDAATAPIVFTSYVGGAMADESTEQFGDEVDFVYSQTAQVCLDIQVMPRASGLVLSWDCVDDYFPAADAMFTRTTGLVGEIAAGGAPWPIVDPESEAAMAEFNNTGDTPGVGETLLTLVEATCNRTPAATAITSPDGTSMTYAEIWQKSGQVARALLNDGCATGDCVVVEFTRHPNDLINFVGVLRAGGVWVPVAADQPEHRKESIRRQSGAALTLHTSDTNRYLGLDGDVPAVAADPEALAYIIFTSGTTGEPKGVEITHAGCVGTIIDINERYRIGADDHFIALSSYGFDLAIYDIFGAFAAGASVGVVADERDADEILDVIERDQITLWNSAPALLELALLRREPNRTFPSVRTVMLSGDRIPPALVADAEAAFPNATVNSLGGATEASIWSIQIPVHPDSFTEAIPYGRPMRGQRFFVLGLDKAPCPTGVPGELWIGGGGVARGYAADAERTAAAFHNLPGIGRVYRTGDLGVFSDKGYIEFLGRVDRQVKIAGHRIELGEIESVLAGSPLVLSSIAGTFERIGRPNLYCAYLPSSGSVTEADVHRELSQHLPDYMIPQVLLPLEELPVTLNGKVDYRALSEWAAAGEDRPTESDVDSATTVEIPEEIRAAWVETVGNEPSSADASFFAEGGDSLGFQRMLRRIEDTTGVRPRFRDVIVDPCLSTLAKVVAASGNAPARLRTTPVHDSPYAPFPLTDMQMAYFIGRGSGFALGGVTEHYYLETIAGIDIRRLEDALNTLIKRHDMLRVVFAEDATQRILAEVPRYCIEVTDLSSATEDEVSTQIMQTRERLSHETFQLDQWPLFRLAAMILPSGQYRLFFSIDMIIGDGASQRIFIDDLSRIYRGEQPLPLYGTFRDYVMELDRRRSTDDPFAALGESRHQELVQTFPPGCTLPVPRTTVAGIPRMARLSRNYSAEDTAALKSAAREMNCSLSALLLAAYASSLAAFSTRDAVGINITTYNRDPDLGEHRNIFGDFTGVLLLPFQDPDIAEFSQLCAETQRSLLADMSANYPGVRLIADIARHHGIVGEAIAPFVFTSLLFDDESSDAKPAAGAGVLGEVDWAVSQTPQVILDNQVLESGGCLNISWDHVADVLPTELAADIFAHFQRTLQSCIDGAAEISALTLPESRRLRLALASQAAPASVTDTVTATHDADADTVAWILDMVRHREGASGVTPTDNLFEKGYDSLGFVGLVQQVQQEVGGPIPLADALAAPTVAALAQLADVAREASAEVSNTALTLLHAGDPNRPVVFIHGGFGSIDIYRDLATVLPGGRQAWGISFDQFARPWPQQLTVEKIAETYAAEIIDTVPTSAPVVVVGWSIGGTLAVETAKQLGQCCAEVVLLDSIAPGYIADVGEFTLEADRHMLSSVRLDGAALPGFNPDAQSLEELWTGLSETSNQAEQVRAVTAAVSTHLLEDLGLAGTAVTFQDLATLRTLIAARNTYKPDVDLPGALFVAPDDGEADNCRNWEKHGITHLDIEQVRGNHYSFVLGADARVTAGIIADYLSRKER